MPIHKFAGADVISPNPLSLLDAETSCSDSVSIATRHQDGPLRPAAMGTVIADGNLGGRRWAFGEALDLDGWVYVFGGGCVGRLTADCASIELTALPEAPDQWLGDVVVNWALVYRLIVQGRWAFHASTVSIDDQTAISIVGASGAGKSTVAASICAEGGSLLGDDVWVGQIRAEVVTAQSTSRQLRLRSAARSLGPLIAHERTFETSDDRLAVEVKGCPLEVPVKAIVLIDGGNEFALRPLDPHLALPRLLAESKVSTWRSDEHRVAEFEHACSIVERVPAFVATLAPVSWDDSPAGLLRQAARLVEAVSSSVG